jgi:putative transposase
LLLCKKIKIEVNDHGTAALEFMQAFFRRVVEGEMKPGFPRVKPRHQFFTLCYPAAYLEVQGNTITLPTGGGGNWGPKRYPNIIAHLTETPPEHFREVAVCRDSYGNYYCSFVYDEEDVVQDGKDDKRNHRKGPKIQKKRAISENGIVAIDLGIKTLATGVTGHGRFYHIGGFKGYRWYNKQLDKIRSKRDRCKKNSRRYIHLSNVYKRVAEKKRRIRNRLVYNDWGLYGFVQMLKYKCLRFGKELYIISERDTTRMCHVCKHLQDMPLWKRTYRCANESCGLVRDRDENSAVNLYQRFVAGLPPHR